ncbi:hypothetical protein VN12_23550 [Pirellula sp. SH-Sr6A]|uniref:GAP1-N1 domain-containing protein n=1 Tax=Pirellula sp. SH-Sr6A TaxID=1632865 RepID=UPI00078C5AE2|nr:effector-associated domain EAD1-containing protein [Pirellula sp. SH-Sr6A]AMV35122.1 hypothetical protein VN12_23550 [Pirellula sp. SH-Sr6A]
MKIKFDTAIFGESGKAHSILHSSIPEFAKTLVAVTDLPLDLPNDAGNTPMLSGFPHDRKYVFLSTLRDASASRGGMARTTALITNIEEVSKIECLDSVFQNLGHDLDHMSLGTAIEFEPVDMIGSIHSVGTVALIRALISSKNSQPVVWIGDEGFRESVCDLWRGLPVTLKRNFTFRYSCTPRDGRIQGTDLILTPVQFRSRWTQQICIQPPLECTPNRQAERYFCDDSVRIAVSKWSDELSAEVNSFETLSLLAESQTLFEQLNSITSLEVTILLRNLARLSPIPNNGKAIKQRVLQELQTRITSGPLDVIGYLRNVEANEFFKGFDAIRIATQQRFTQAIAMAEENSLDLMRQAIKDASRPWAVGILSAFTHILKQKQKSALDLCWRLIATSAEIVVQSWLVQTSEKIQRFERCLIDTIPKSLSEVESQLVATFCKRNNWANLHAIVISSNTNPQLAIAEQLHFQKASDNGFRELSRRLGNRVFVRAAMQTELVPALFNQVVIDCIEDIQLLDMFDIYDFEWRRVLRGIINLAPKHVDQSTVLDNAIEAYWPLHVEGTLIDIDLLGSLSGTKYANLVYTNNRQEIWDSLPANVCGEFLKVTARAWIDRALHDIASLARPEPVLVSEILSNNNRQQLLPVSGADSVVFALSAFRVFPELTQSDFDDWRVRLLTAQRNLPTTTARQIGALLSKNGWRNCADGLLSDYSAYSRQDLHPALCECSNLFGWLTRFRYGFSRESPSIDQWWEEIENVLLYLYPEGPRDKHLWERSGGHVGDLRVHTTGREQWSKLITDLKKGKDFGEASLNTLLSVCLSDYGSNSDITLLVANCPFKLRISRDDSFVD